MGGNSISKYKQSSSLLELQTGGLFADYMLLGVLYGLEAWIMIQICI